MKIQKTVFITAFVIVMCLSIGTPKIHNYPFVPNEKFIILGVPNFRQITAFNLCYSILGHLKS